MARSRLSLILAVALMPACAQCPDPLTAPTAPVDRLAFPTGLALHPTEPVLFAANSNFDLAYSTGAVVGANLSWLLQRLQTEERITEPIEQAFTAAVLVPSQGGPLKFSPDGRFLYHLTREQNQLVQLDVRVTDATVAVGCGGTTDGLDTCTSGDHVLQIPTNDPFGLAVRDVGGALQLLIGVLINGNLFSVIHDPLAAASAQLQQDWVRSLGPNDYGASLAIVPAVDGWPDYLLATGREVPGSNTTVGHLRMLNLAQAPDTPALRVDLRDEVGAMDIRGVAVSTRRPRAYVVSKVPAAVIELDMTRGADGAPLAQVMRVAQVGKEASAIALYEPDEKGPNLILTTSFRDGLVMALDMDTMEVFDVTRDVGRNPFEIAVDARRGFAFVGNFNDDTVSVIRLPQGPEDTRFGVVATLGVPRDIATSNPDLPTSLSDLPPLPVSLPFGQ